MESAVVVQQDGPVVRIVWPSANFCRLGLSHFVAGKDDDFPTHVAERQVAVPFSQHVVVRIQDGLDDFFPFAIILPAVVFITDDDDGKLRGVGSEFCLQVAEFGPKGCSC